MGKIIGIDLGTTNSCVAILEGGDAKVLTNAQGNRTTPSIVGITEKGERLIGLSAKNQQTTNPTNTIYSVKRFMGRRHNEVHGEEKIVPYKVTGGENDPVKVEAHGKEYTPPEISAMILRDLKKTAEDYLGTTVDAAVITVPAYFNDAQRKATQEAGVIAGFDVKRVLPEPTAAALAYGLDKHKQMKIAVFDLGGGTFDISILDVGDGVFETLAINGDTHLGGDDFDQAVINYVAEEFRKQSGIDLKKDAMAYQRLKDACEKAKKELSSSVETKVSLPFITADASGPKHLDVTISRSKFEQITDKLLDRLKQPVLNAIKDSGLSTNEINECILVGGSTRIPAVQQLCKDLFGKEPNKSVNPDEAVALGAAIQAGIIAGDVTDILVLDVTPLSLGVETMGGVMTTMIQRNTTIPTNKKEIYSTATDNQTEVTIHVLQGERQFANDNRTLGKFNLAGLPPAPRGIPQVEVSFDIDANGILNVSAKDQATGASQEIKIEGSSGLSEDEVERMKKESEEHAEDDKKRKAVVDAKNQADHLIYSAEKSLKEHEELLSSEDRSTVESAIDNLKEVMKSDEIDAINKAVKNLSEGMQIIGKVAYEKSQEKQSETQSSQDTDEDVIDADFEVKE